MYISSVFLPMHRYRDPIAVVKNMLEYSPLTKSEENMQWASEEYSRDGKYNPTRTHPSALIYGLQWLPRSLSFLCSAKASAF